MLPEDSMVWGANMEIEERASHGDGQAQVALALRYESEGRNEMARGWFARAAQTGQPDALRQLAENLMVRPPIRPREGAEMMRTVAMDGDARASFICAAIAGQASDEPGRWHQALDFLAQAKRQGSVEGAEALRLLAGPQGQEAPWDVAVRRMDQARDAALANSRVRFETPRIGTCEKFASAPECDWLMARAATRLKDAELYDPASDGGFRNDALRNNRDASFNMVQSDLVLVQLQARIAALIALDVQEMEPAMVLHYAPGQYFAPHCDGLDPAAAPQAREIARNGQRVATLLIYLNDDYQGGDTDFPDLGWRFKGARGDALWFWNVDGAGSLDPRTRHAGLAPSGGEKWLLSQWIRQRS
jgi:prolyl 4-hydroxylase